MKKTWVRGALLIIGLIISFVLCRYVFFDIHGMKDCPIILAAAALVIILIALFLSKRILPIMTGIGYIGGFVLGALFKMDGVDSGGGATNNLWIIWGAVFGACVIIGIVAEWTSKTKAAKG